MSAHIWRIRSGHGDATTTSTTNNTSERRGAERQAAVVHVSSMCGGLGVHERRVALDRLAHQSTRCRRALDTLDHVRPLELGERAQHLLAIDALVRRCRRRQGRRSLGDTFRVEDLRMLFVQVEDEVPLVLATATATAGR